MRGVQATANHLYSSIRRPVRRRAVFLEVYPQVLGVSTLKRCTKCGEYKDTAGFRRDKQKKDGYSPICRSCKRITDQAYLAKNRAKNADRCREYRAAHREELKRANREYYASHREENRANRRKYYEENRERIKQKSRDYHNANQERDQQRSRSYRQSEHGRLIGTIHSINRRAQKRDRGGYLTKDQIAIIRAAQTDKRGRLICWRCGKPITDTPHLDHWIPLDKGGAHSSGNLHYMHAKCNMTKHAKHPTEIGRLI